jgi:hypothetical protein
LFSPETQLNRRARYEQIESPQPTLENSSKVDVSLSGELNQTEDLYKNGNTFAVISKPSKPTPKRSFDDEEYVRY